VKNTVRCNWTIILNNNNNNNIDVNSKNVRVRVESHSWLRTIGDQEKVAEVYRQLDEKKYKVMLPVLIHL
jgi:hypothetical protein